MKISMVFKSRFERWRFRSLSHEQEQVFDPTPEEMELIESFGTDRTVFNEVLASLETSGVPRERIHDVWKLIRERRRTQLGQAGKERQG